MVGPGDRRVLCRGRSATAWVLIAGWVAIAGAAGADEPLPPGASGVTLAGRSEDGDATPERWWLVDKATGKKVADVRGRWGSTAVPPGDYEVAFEPRGHGAIPVRWGDVRVEPGRVATVEVTSGVDLVGREEVDPPEHWEVLDTGTGKPVARTWRRWGFAPLPPGTYRVRVRPQGHGAVEVPWGEVTVEPGRAARLDATSGVEVVGREGAEDTLDYWDVVDKATGEKVAHAWHRWGFTPVRPGTYTVRVRPNGHGAVDIPWADVTVGEGRAARVEVRSGVEVVGRSPDDEELDHWDAVDAATGKVMAHTWRRWGFTPLPPGSYSVRVRPQGDGAIELAWRDVTVAEGSVVAVKVASGIELVGRPDQPPVERWTVVDAATRKPAASVYRRWGFTPLPPGTYEITRDPMRWPATPVGPDEVVVLREPDLEARWARVTGAGRKTEKERDPEGWRRLEEEVERAIRRAAAWLKTHSAIAEMKTEGNAELPTIGILALVHSGELERDPALARRCLDLLRRRKLNTGRGTYANSLTAMALRDMGALRHRPRIFECATWLVENQNWDDERGVWAYGVPVAGFEDTKPPEDRSARHTRARPSSMDVVRRGLATKPPDGWDNSNVQFGVLGLHAAAQARIGIPRGSWERVERHFRGCQNPDGSWGYSSGSTGSMTCAGVASLVVARHHLGEKRPVLDDAVVHGLEWLDWQFTVEDNPRAGSDHYYFLYGLERVGVLAGTEFLGDHEWYPLGARYLLAKQNGNGSWLDDKGGSTGDSSGYLDTCYAILFLRRATLPLETEAPALLSVAADEGALKKDLLPAVELILDSSGSMKDPVDGKPKVEIARAVLAEALAGLSEDVQVGLRLYGHRHVWIDRSANPRAKPLDPSDPRVKTDSELVVPIGPLDERRRAEIRKWIDSAQPRGWTPMVHSLLEARKDFPETGKAPRTVVLVSDGEETGGGKLEDVAAAYQGSGIEMKIHVVGFDIAGTPAERQLQEIARIGKGRYYGARNARELAEGLRAAVPTLGFEVLDAEGKGVARGSLNAEPVQLKPGRYRVRLLGLESEPVEVALEEGEEAVLEVDAAGKLVGDGS